MESVTRDARELLLFRISFCGLLALSHAYWYTGYLGRVERGFVVVPDGWLPLYIDWAPALGLVFIGSLLTCAAGLYPRISAIVAMISYFLYQSPIQTWSQSHLQNVPFWLLLSLCFAPAIGHRSLREPKPINGWFFRAAEIYVALMFFSAGVTKLADSGVSWADGQTLQLWLVRYYFWYDSGPHSLWLAKHVGLCQILSLAVLLFELSFVLVLLFPRFSKWWIALSLFFLLQVRFWLGIDFFDPFIVTYFAFVPWSHFLSPKPAKAPQEQRTASKLLIVGCLLFQLSCLIFRAQVWPLSDYKIYSHYQSLAQKPTILRLAAKEPDGSLTIIPEPKVQLHYLVRRGTYREKVRKQIASLGLRAEGIVFLRTRIEHEGSELKFRDEILLEF